ncbi:DegT/DnrJ/EryC1/StrS aminotransferase family protein [Pseudonocardia sp. KRD-291]|nr:DegT/DnrJ/EryC1/StrS aminotransferase family protein [Pseudonocardia sp. KRD291]
MIELGAPVLGEPEKRALAEVVDSGWLAMGERVRSFEQAFARMHGVEDAVAVSSATAALQVVLATFGIGPGDEVLVPSLSFVATANVVVAAGATPVFVDIEAPERPHMSIEEARARITSSTRAILIMHYAGYTMDVPAWRRLADEYGLFLFEDAAHAAGATGAVGVYSDAAAFSFFANKNLTTGEGGMVLVRGDAPRARMRLMRAHGMTTGTLDRVHGRTTAYDVVECGTNCRMDELRGALGLVQLQRLPEWNECRRGLSTRYRELLAEMLPEVLVPFDRPDPTVAHLFPVLLPPGADRRSVVAAMTGSRVQTSVHYAPIHRFDFYRRRFGALSLPRTERFADGELTLPLHPRLTEADVSRVVATLAEALGRTTGRPSREVAS